MEPHGRSGGLLEKRPRLLLIGACALALLLGMYRIHSHPLSMDAGQTDNFWPIANHLLDGEGYSLCYPLYFPFCPGEHPPPTAMREPVPVLLFTLSALMSGRSLLFAMYVQLFLFIGIVVLTYYFTRGMAGVRAAVIAAWGWAIYLPASGLLNQLSADITGTFFLMVSAVVLQRAMRERSTLWWVLSGVTLGVAALSRSALLLMALPWGLAALAAHGGRWRSGTTWIAPVLVGMSMLVVMAPWAIRNEHVFHKAWLGTSMNGYNVWRMNSLVGNDQPLHFVDAFEADTMSRELLARHPELTGNENEAEMDLVYRKEGFAAIRSNPGKYVRLCGYRILELTVNMDVKQSYGASLNTLDRVAMAEQSIMLVLTLLGIWRTRRSQWVWILAVLVQVAGYCALVAQMRYMVPIMPLLIAFAALATTSLRWPSPGGDQA